MMIVPLLRRRARGSRRCSRPPSRRFRWWSWVAPLILHGQMGKNARAKVIDRLAEAPDTDGRGLVLAATQPARRGLRLPATRHPVPGLPDQVQGQRGAARRPDPAPNRHQDPSRGPRLRRHPHPRPRPHARRATHRLRHPRLPAAQAQEATVPARSLTLTHQGDLPPGVLRTSKPRSALYRVDVDPQGAWVAWPLPPAVGRGRRAASIAPAAAASPRGRAWT